MTIFNFISFIGLITLLLIALTFSENRKVMNWHLIFWGLSIQFVIALIIFVLPIGAKIFLILNDIVVQVLNSAQAGSEFIFGRLALSPGQNNTAGEQSLGFILAFQGFPTIIFFSSLISILYYVNIMPRVIRTFSSFFTKLMKISGAESVVAASNIFVGIESAFTVKPHLKDMTKSEINTVLTVGMATVASNILALYVFSLKEQFPTIAAHLISASLLSAPAALIVSKIIIPETDTPKTLGIKVTPDYNRDSNLFEAIINGANSGVKMIVGISALLIAVLGLVSLTDLFLIFINLAIKSTSGILLNLNLKNILSFLFYPLTLLLGIPSEDALTLSGIIGERLILTEVVSYQDLSLLIKDGIITNPRSIIITTYALCGFAHIASMAIFTGGLSALIPEKTKIISKVALKALIGSTIACLITACVAGIFCTSSSLLF